MNTIIAFRYTIKINMIKLDEDKIQGNNNDDDNNNINSN